MNVRKTAFWNGNDRWRRQDVSVNFGFLAGNALACPLSVVFGRFGSDKTCRNETVCGSDARITYGMNVMEKICCWNWLGTRGRNVFFVETSPKSESCGERGMAVMCRYGRLCKAGMDWYVCCAFAMSV
jgi:hypothetical protein